MRANPAWTFLIGSTVAIALGVCGSSRAEDLDPKTVTMIRSILALRQESLSKIKDLKMSGTISTAWKSGTEERQSKINYDYYQLGHNKRLDAEYREYADNSLLVGRTKRMAVTDKAAISFITDTELASVRGPEDFEWQSELQQFNTLVITRRWSDYAEEIEYYLGRGWDPQTDRIAVKQVTEQGKKLVCIHYEVASKFFSKDWLFSPDQGWQVVKATYVNLYDQNRPYMKSHVAYELREVAPGAWRPVSADIDSQHWGKDGKLTTQSRQIRTSDIKANTGQITSDMFTLHGLGVPPRMLVGDLNSIPLLDVAHGNSLVAAEDLDAILAAASPKERAGQATSASASQPTSGQTPGVRLTPAQIQKELAKNSAKTGLSTWWPWGRRAR